VDEKMVLLFSGGLDSTVLLYDLINQGHYVQALCVDYGQSHRREMESAVAITDKLNIRLETTALDPALFTGSLLTGSDENVIVPNRNAVLISLAGAVAVRDGLDYVAIACQAGDYALWPDCRPNFMEAMFNALSRCDPRQIKLLYPFVRKTKLDIVRLGYSLGVPFELTWTCYAGGESPCGTCVACLGRREAFLLAGVPCSA
jgi:7-cyano-7-deazaguanine synthase